MTRHKLQAALLALTLLPLMAGPARADDDWGRDDYHQHKNWQREERMSPLNRGITLYRQKQYVDAAALFEQAVARDRNDLDANLYLARSYIALGRQPEAVPYLQAALRLSPPGSQMANEMVSGLEPRLAAEVWRRFGTNMAYNPGEDDPQVGAYQSTIEAYPNDVDARMRLGMLLLNRGRNEEAAFEFQRAIGLAPNNADAHFHLGVAYAKLDRWISAQNELETALELRPGFPEAAAWMTRVMRRENG